jgi:hypothetical protein
MNTGPGPVTAMGKAAGSRTAREAETIIVMLCQHLCILHRTLGKMRDDRVGGEFDVEAAEPAPILSGRRLYVKLRHYRGARPFCKRIHALI